MLLTPTVVSASATAARGARCLCVIAAPRNEPLAIHRVMATPRSEQPVIHRAMATPRNEQPVIHHTMATPRNEPLAIHRGMTFIEVLIAVALSALIIVAASMLIFVLTNTWGNLQTRPQFEQHVQGVTSTLETLFERTETLSGNDVRPWGWTAPPESNVRTFAFRLREPLPIFVLPYGPQSNVEAWLEFDPERKRLWLTWYTDARLTQNRRQLQYTLLSDQVEDIELGYLDSSTNIWEFESMSQAGRTHADTSPSRLRITFAPGGNSGTPIYRTINPDRPLRRVLMF